MNLGHSGRKNVVSFLLIYRNKTFVVIRFIRLFFLFYLGRRVEAMFGSRRGVEVALRLRPGVKVVVGLNPAAGYLVDKLGGNGEDLWRGADVRRRGARVVTLDQGKMFKNIIINEIIKVMLRVNIVCMTFFYILHLIIIYMLCNKKLDKYNFSKIQS